jgi:hypothetical protein
MEALSRCGISASQQNQNLPIAKAGNARCSARSGAPTLLFEDQDHQRDRVETRTT